jgi:integrase/recombinase XerD
MKPLDGKPTWRKALQFFLGEYLPRHRGVSPRTQEAYATALRLLTERIDTHSRGPHELTVPEVLQFLEGLEQTRRNTANTRNLRLAALKAFWKAMLLWDAAHQARYQQLLAVPSKRHTSRSPDYLESEELGRLFQAVDPVTPQGFRDLTILRYLYNTGSRISEVAGARTTWLSLVDRPEVMIRGKGGKSRVCPLWPTTAEMLRVYLRQERMRPRRGYEDFLFLTRQGTAFRRQSLWKLLHGYFQRAADAMPTLRRKHLTPHSMRHTTGVHLLRAGVDINVIKAWLGHADVSTTSRYLDLDLDKKREALDRFLKLDLERLAPGPDSVRAPLPAYIVSWLERL